MKHLYIRFFRDREDTMPHNSWRVTPGDNLESDINQWLGNFPEGKVDFCYL